MNTKNTVIDYKERPITIGLSFGIEYRTIGQLFINSVAENRYTIGSFSTDNSNKTEYKKLSCFFNTIFLRQFIIDKLKYKDDDGNTVDDVDIFFINTKNYGYKSFYIGDICKNIIRLETLSVIKINEIEGDGDIINNINTNKYCSKVTNVLDKYLKIQSTIAI